MLITNYPINYNSKSYSKASNAPSFQSIALKKNVNPTTIRKELRGGVSKAKSIMKNVGNHIQEFYRHVRFPLFVSTTEDTKLLRKCMSDLRKMEGEGIKCNKDQIIPYKDCRLIFENLTFEQINKKLKTAYPYSCVVIEQEPLSLFNCVKHNALPGRASSTSLDKNITIKYKPSLLLKELNVNSELPPDAILLSTNLACDMACIPTYKNGNKVMSTIYDTKTGYAMSNTEHFYNEKNNKKQYKITTSYGENGKLKHVLYTNRNPIKGVEIDYKEFRRLFPELPKLNLTMFPQKRGFRYFSE